MARAILMTKIINIQESKDIAKDSFQREQKEKLSAEFASRDRDNTTVQLEYSVELLNRCMVAAIFQNIFCI